MAAPTKSGSGDIVVHPPVLQWAQRKDKVFVTAALENCPNPLVEIKSNTLYFRGKGGTENLEHEVTVELFAEIDPEKSKRQTNNRHTEFTLIKKDKTAPYWPRLTKENRKFHYIKTDFNRWQDEDEDDFDLMRDDFDFKTAMSSMHDEETEEQDGATADDEEDSDDEDVPNL